MHPRVTEVADGVYAVTASHTNFVILTEGEAATLVDTGYPGDRQLLEESLRSIGRSLADVEAVLLTHGHVDHIGSAGVAQRRGGRP